jgi:antitoxin MazE
MRVAKWGNSLAVLLPAAVVEALDLKPGDQIHLHVTGERSFAVEKVQDAAEWLACMRKFRGRLPAGFTFDRAQTHERE